MSMLSAQCDELRELALWLDDEFYDAEATKVRDAADTIWELRDDLQRANADNAKLRELVRDMWEGYNDPRCEECHLKDTPTCADCPICAREAAVIDRMRELGGGRVSDVTTELAMEANDKAVQIARLKSENAKLRECLQDLAEHIREDDGFGLDYGWMLDRMRELGVDE